MRQTTWVWPDEKARLPRLLLWDVQPGNIGVPSMCFSGVASLRRVLGCRLHQVTPQGVTHK